MSDPNKTNHVCIKILGAKIRIKDRSVAYVLSATLIVSLWFVWKIIQAYNVAPVPA